MTEEKKIQILIIDDNQDIQEDFTKILGVASAPTQLDAFATAVFGEESETPAIPLINFHVDSASQGEEGVRYIEQAIKDGTPYALAFVDMRMPPGWDGVTTIKHIWALDQDIQIVICTAYSDYTWEETIAELGVRDNLLILKKPFDAVAVRQLACALTRKWDLMQDSREYTRSLEKRVEERTHSLQQSLSIIQATLESSIDGIIVVDESGVIINHNSKFMNIWEILEPISGKNYNAVVQTYIMNKLVSSPNAALSTGDINIPIEINKNHIKLKNGKIYECHAQPCKTEHKKIGLVWSFRDVTDAVSSKEQIEYQATHDKLTGLPNRTLLFDRIDQGISVAKRENLIVAILFFDLDRFKVINDSLGHGAGDEALKGFVKHVKSLIRESDTFARIGGDEFVMVIPDLTHEEQIIPFLNKLLTKMKDPIKFLDQEITITSSIGISLYPKDGTNIEELMRTADLAMYKAKECGTNQFQFYTAELNQQSSERFKSVTELRNAIEQEEFFCVYQPQFHLETSRITAVEALLRWQHPERGVIPPLDFIPLAEETGLIIPLGEWVLRTACQQNKAWQDKGLPPIRVAVNMGALQFRQSDLVATVKNILQETKLSPEYLEIELTENIIFDNNKMVMKIINELREIGVHIALDDFGIGNTSINCLRDLPLDHLKIDKSFIQTIDLQKSGDVIVQAIMSMAESLDLDVVAEGVETETQLNFLKENKCNTIQGYHFSKPLSVNNIEEILRRFNI